MTETLLEETKKSLKRVQEFNTETLPRREELGSAMSFEPAVKSAERIIRLFKQIPIDYLVDITEDNLNRVKIDANAFYNLIESILNFSPEKIDAPTLIRQQYIEQISNFYDRSFNNLHPIISYLSSRLRDFAALEQQARAAVQSATDQANELKQQLENDRLEAQNILAEVRQVAAEQGVSQQAVYFKNEAERHEDQADEWRKYTIWTAVLLAFLSAASIATYKLNFLSPDSTYQAIQLTLGKILAFGTAAYLLVLCARNFLSHKHNSIVNKHRQNALLTFNTLVEASRGEYKRDIILTHAASCIFSPQETGYTKSGSSGDTMSTKLIEIVPKLTNSA